MHPSPLTALPETAAPLPMAARGIEATQELRDIDILPGNFLDEKLLRTKGVQYAGVSLRGAKVVVPEQNTVDLGPALVSLDDHIPDVTGDDEISISSFLPSSRSSLSRVSSFIKDAGTKAVSTISSIRRGKATKMNTLQTTLPMQSRAGLFGAALLAGLVCVVMILGGNFASRQFDGRTSTIPGLQRKLQRLAVNRALAQAHAAEAAQQKPAQQKPAALAKPVNDVTLPKTAPRSVTAAPKSKAWVAQRSVKRSSGKARAGKPRRAAKSKSRARGRR